MTEKNNNLKNDPRFKLTKSIFLNSINKALPIEELNMLADTKEDLTTKNVKYYIAFKYKFEEIYIVDEIKNMQIIEDSDNNVKFIIVESDNKFTKSVDCDVHPDLVDFNLADYKSKWFVYTD